MQKNIRPWRLRVCLFLGLCCLLSPLDSWAAAPSADSAAVQKSLKSFIAAIRYGKDAIAIKYISCEDMAQALLGDSAAQMTAEQRQQFTAGLATLLQRLSFPKGRDLFKYLDAVLYDPATAQGDQVHCRSTVVVHRDLKKQEIPIEWVLVKRAGQYKVLDIVTAGESTTAAIRQDQILPLLKQGGVDALLAAVREKIATTP
jgi:ABC-type transporter MlaC component